MKTNYAAGISLAVMAGGFAVTTFLGGGHEGAAALLQGGFEAGLVGGVADWFAVSALFRHPLGLRIPHTNLILRNKNKMIAALVAALENELLNKESISARIRRLNLIGGAGAFIVRYLARRSNRLAVISAAEAVIERLPFETPGSRDSRWPGRLCEASGSPSGCGGSGRIHHPRRSG